MDVGSWQAPLQDLKRDGATYIYAATLASVGLVPAVGLHVGCQGCPLGTAGKRPEPNRLPEANSSGRLA